MTKKKSLHSLADIQQHVTLGTDKVEERYIEAIGSSVPLRPLSKRELIKLSSMATNGISVTYDEEGNPTTDFDFEEVIENEARMDAEAVAMGLAVEDKENLTADVILDSWKPGAIAEIAEQVFDVSGENPKDTISNEKKDKEGKQEKSFRKRGKKS